MDLYSKILLSFCLYTNIQPSTSNILYVLQNCINIQTILPIINSLISINYTNKNTFVS